MRVKQFGQRRMIRMKEPVKPRLMPGMIERVAGDRMAVAGDRDDRGGMLLAVAIAYQAADIALKRGDPGPLRHQRADFGHAQIDRDVLAEQRRIDPQINVIGHTVGGMIGHHQNPAVIPIASDGHAVPGNALDHAGHLARLERFYHPYHAALADLLNAHPPALTLSLHSFTPLLASSDAPRPWQVGVLYNQDDRAARLAIPLLEADGLVVGDQQPYSGQLLNATMNRHAEADGRPYLGIEIRQDQITTPLQHAEWAARLGAICNRVALMLA